MLRLQRCLYFLALQITWFAAATSLVFVLTSCGRDSQKDLTENVIEEPVLDPFPPPAQDCAVTESGEPLVLEGPQTARVGTCTPMTVVDSTVSGPSCTPYPTAVPQSSPQTTAQNDLTPLPSTDPYVSDPLPLAPTFAPEGSLRDIPVMLASTSQYTYFYSDSQCQRQIAGIFIPKGYDKAKFYFRHQKNRSGWQAIWITAAEWDGSPHDLKNGSLSRHRSMEIWVR